MYARLQLALWSSLAILGVGYSEAADNKTSAKNTPAAKSANQTAASEGHDFGRLINDLHHAKHLLDHANHTYNGHRAKADHEIGKAIHILHPEHHKKGTTAAHAKGQHQTESQQASDTQLRQAEKLVHAAIHELHQHHGEKAHHAKKLLHEAAHEIELAIHLHHKHHQNLQNANANPAGALKKVQ